MAALVIKRVFAFIKICASLFERDSAGTVAEKNRCRSFSTMEKGDSTKQHADKSAYLVLFFVRQEGLELSLFNLQDALYHGNIDL